MKNVGLLITGNEVLSAKTKDTNGPFLGRWSHRYGYPVKATVVSPDHEADLTDSLDYLAQRCDVIFMTGGLGPTSDDLTAKVVAQFFGVPLEFNEQAWANVTEAFARMGRTEIPETNKKQAWLPQGCGLLPNAVGTAIGFFMERPGLSVYCMPGVPYEMEPMFEHYVFPRTLALGKQTLSNTWQVFFLGESKMQSLADPFEKPLLAKYQNDAAISYQAHTCYVTYSINLFLHNHLEQEQDQEKKESFASFCKAVEQSFGPYILFRAVQSLNEHVRDLFLQKNISIFLTEILCNTGDKDTAAISSLHTCTALKSSCGLVLLETKEQVLFLGLAILQNCIRDPQALTQRLEPFGWQKILSPQEDFYLLGCQPPLNPRHPADVRKRRAIDYGYCSLVLVGSELLGAQ